MDNPAFIPPQGSLYDPLEYDQANSHRSFGFMTESDFEDSLLTTTTNVIDSRVPLVLINDQVTAELEDISEDERLSQDLLRIPAEGAEEDTETNNFLSSSQDNEDAASRPGSPTPDYDRRPSGKQSSDDVELELMESDPDFVEDFKAMVKSRKRSMRGSRKRRRRKSSQRSIYSDVGSECPSRAEGEDDDDNGRHEDGNNDKSYEDPHVIMENIQIQKEIIQKVKFQAWGMRKKLKTIRLATAYLMKYEGKLTTGHGLYKQVGIKYWEKTKREILNFLSLFVPWEMRIKKIESHFGCIVSSYFIFLRWLFGVNIFLTVITLGCVVIPEIIAGDPFGSTPRKSIPDNEKTNALNLDTIWNFNGYLKYSVLFYGYYGNSKTIGNGYRLPLAYFLIGVFSIIASFAMILRRMAKNSRLNKVSHKDEQFSFGWRLFTSWDYMIGNNETAKNKAAEISTNFKESILEEKEKSREENKYSLIAMRVVANIMVVAVLASSTYAIYIVVKRSTEIDQHIAKGEKVSWLEQNMVALVTAVITAIYPSIFELIGMMEKYHPRINLRWQLARILVLYLLNLYTLVVALYWKIKYETNLINIRIHNDTHLSCPQGNFTDGSLFLNGTDHNCTVTIATSTTKDKKLICWETDIGQELVKLTTFDLVISVITIILIDFVRGLVVRYLNPCWCWDLERKFPEYGEFKIAENILHLINNQAMIWLGIFFSPVLPGLNLVKMIILLYTRSWAVLMCNIPHERVFKASRSNNFYQALLLLMLFLITCLVIFLLVQLPPSPDCGPFSGYTRSYAVLTDLIENEFPLWVNSVMNYIASPGVIIPLFLLFVLAVFYLISLTRSLKELNKDLRQQLLYERTEERKKIYAMADARKETMSRSRTEESSLLQLQNNENQNVINSSQQPAEKRILKIRKLSPNVTHQEIDEMKEQNPNLCIIDGNIAKRLQSMAGKN